MKLARKPHGAVLSFIVAAIFVVVLIGIAFATLLMLIGGNRQGTNANDAGNLNVAKCAPLVQVNGGNAGVDFLDISPTNQFNLTNINEVWGKTLLVNLNEQAMQQQGLSTPVSNANAALTWSRAVSLSRSLSAALNTRAKLVGFHQSVADRNRVNMLTLDRSVDVTGKWRTSCMNRNAESNIVCVPAQLPPGITLASLGNPVVTKIDPKTGKPVILWAGYRGISAAGRSMNFVPFEYGSIPHHVSLKTFVANTLAKNPMPRCPNSVPNAFESVAVVKDSSLRDHLFDSAALSSMGVRKPTTPPHIPNGFIRFRVVPDNMQYFYHFPTPFSAPIHVGGYPNLPKLRGQYKSNGVSDPTAPGTSFDIAFQYGHQYEDPAMGNASTLYMAVFAMGPQMDAEPMYDSLKNMLVNRCNQIRPGTTWEQIKALLHSTNVPPAGGTFILKLNGSALGIDTADSGLAPDGKPMPAIEGIVKNSANTLTSVIHTGPPIVHGGIPKGFHTFWIHHLDVIPGSGANKALLDVVQVDHADGHFYPGPSLP